MELTWHPPVAVRRRGGVAPGSSTQWAYGHLRLWVRLKIEPWRVVREGHLHLLRPLTNGARFVAVDLARRPLVVIPGGKEPEGLREQIAASSQEWLHLWRPTFWRLSELELVSELGETEDGFRRRVHSVLQPELQRRLDRVQAPPLPRLPWRRRSELERRRAAREELAQALVWVMGHLESWTADSAESAARSLEAGLLMADEDLLPSGCAGPSD